ncbi:MAG: thioredoxin domain-containing protein [Phycisphaerales bacterium]|nr:MAG: thioredoxin domain-containing protein [Phycisphaerales bacterium]
MFRRTLVQTLAVAFSLAAAYISFNLLAKHVSGSSGLAWFESTCNPGEEGGDGKSKVNCDAVLATPWSYIPPKFKDDPADKYRFGPFRLQYPAAFLGMVYYSALAFWFVSIGHPSRNRRWVLLLPVIGMALGLLSSAFFSYLMFFTELESWCPWCMVTHVLNVVIFALLLLMWPRARKTAEEPTQAKPASETAARASLSASTTEGLHPSTRHVLATLIACVLIAFGQSQILGRAEARLAGVSAARNFKACVTALRRLKSDSNRLVKLWQDSEERPVTIRPDDPSRTCEVTDRPCFEVVIFSDFECPSCGRFAEFVDNKVGALFGGSLLTVFKHYPLNSGCNPRAGTRMHKYACRAARWAEGARMIGGNDAFWEVHDYLFKQQAKLKSGLIKNGTIAELLGLDSTELKAVAASEAVTNRLAEDAELAVRCGVHGTPAVYIDGKQVDVMTKGEIGFWDILADRYWESIDTPRPPTTQLPVVEATADTPGPSGDR